MAKFDLEKYINKNKYFYMERPNNGLNINISKLNHAYPGFIKSMDVNKFTFFRLNLSLLTYSQTLRTDNELRVIGNTLWVDVRCDYNKNRYILLYDHPEIRRDPLFLYEKKAFYRAKISPLVWDEIREIKVHQDNIDKLKSLFEPQTRKVIPF